MRGRTFAVVRWSPEHDGPMGSDNIGKVLEIIREQDGRFWLGGPDRQLNVVPDQMLNIGELPFGIGDQVQLADGRRAQIVDCVWHYAKEQPMYFLAFDSKLSGRRYFADELGVAEPNS